MRQTTIVTLLTAAILTSAHPVPAAPAAKKKVISIGGCSSFRQERFGANQNGGLRFELRNTCAFPLTCTMSWTVTCRDRQLPSPGSRSAELQVGPHATESTLASGSACGRGGWDIGDITWRCDRTVEREPESDL